MFKRIADMLLRGAKAAQSGAAGARQQLERGGALAGARGVAGRNRVPAGLALLAAACGLLGYLVAGLPFFSALYAALALFFVHPVSDASNLLVTLGKFLALAAVIGAVIRLARGLLAPEDHREIDEFEDSTAVYTDNPWGEALAARLEHGYVGQERGGRLEGAKNHVFMYADDLRNLNLYAAHRRETRRAAVMLNRVDAARMKADEGRGEGPRCFNVYDMLARSYWREHSLYGAVSRRDGEPMRVAILGCDGGMGRAICKYALLNNVYRPDQAIEYHLWGCDRDTAVFLHGLDLMNGDSLAFHRGDGMGDLALLCGMNRVILAQRDNIAMLEALLAGEPAAQLHCYNDGRADLGEVYDYPQGRIVSFGDAAGVLTAENVLDERMLRQAKLLRYDEVLRGEGIAPDALPEAWEEEMDRAWRELDGFRRGEYVSRADHLWIEKRLIADGFREDVAALEHIRRCRFRLYNRRGCGPDAEGTPGPNGGPAGRATREPGARELYSDRVRELMEGIL